MNNHMEDLATMPTGRRAAADSADTHGSAARIGIMCELFGLTPRAIRHYEERGLVHPRRDAVNRRVFNPTDRARIGLIAMLRRADLAIEDIAALLREENLADLKNKALGLLHARRERLKDQLSAVAEAIVELEQPTGP